MAEEAALPALLVPALAEGVEVMVEPFILFAIL